MACSSGTDAARSYPHKPQHRFVRRADTIVQGRVKMQARAKKGNNNQHRNFPRPGFRGKRRKV